MSEKYRERLKNRFLRMYKCEVKKEIEESLFYENEEELFRDLIEWKLEYEKEKIKELVKKLY